MSLFKAKVYSDGQGALVCLHQDVQKERRELANKIKRRLKEERKTIDSASGGIIGTLQWVLEKCLGEKEEGANTK